MGAINLWIGVRDLPNWELVIWNNVRKSNYLLVTVYAGNSNQNEKMPKKGMLAWEPHWDFQGYVKLCACIQKDRIRINCILEGVKWALS